MSKYGDLPTELGMIELHPTEMMFYQYLPIKLKRSTQQLYEKRLSFLNEIVNKCCDDFIETFGIQSFLNINVYLTVKYMWQDENNVFNRKGYHSDGFMTDDINYIWSDKNPTVFNYTDFNLTQDDEISLVEMNWQEDRRKQVTYPNKTLLRLNQYNIHKVNEHQEPGMRLFFKLSFSKDKYDLIGNSHNYELDYNWNMKPRKTDRNIPQSEIKKSNPTLPI